MTEETEALQVDAEILRYILEALTSGAARLKGERCEFTDNRTAHQLSAAAAEVKEILEQLK